jgi:hypothetical protein
MTPLASAPFVHDVFRAQVISLPPAILAGENEASSLGVRIVTATGARRVLRSEDARWRAGISRR